MSTYQGDDDIVMVPVPRSKLGAVYVALGTAYTAPVEPAAVQGAPAQAEEAVEVYGQGPWTASQVARLEHELRRLRLSVCSSRA